MSNDHICHRLIIKGKIVIPQTLHIGSGESSLQTDAPIRRDKNGNPYIPGTTLAGLMRSAAEELAPYTVSSGLESVKGLFGIVEEVDGKTKSNASRIFVEDAPLAKDISSDAIEIRDHVGMDRSSGSARKNFKYDKEVTPSDTSYHLEISIEKPTSDDLRIILDVLDFWSEFDFAFHIGGRTTTGLGRAKLEKDLEFYKLDFGDPEILMDYLTGGDPKQEYIPEMVKPAKRSDVESLAANSEKISPETDNKPHSEAFLPQHLLLKIALTPQEPILVQGSVPEIPEGEVKIYGDRSADADFVTAITAQNGERYYVPGSSLKGVFRTRAEKVVRTLNYHRCTSNYDNKLCACAITHVKDEPVGRLLGCFGTRERQESARAKARDNDEFARELYEKSCVTCRIFGNPLMRGKLHFSDAELSVTPYAKLFDHVAIDRFHGGAADQRKFDDRPLMPQMSDEGVRLPVFNFYVHLERPAPWMLGMLALLLKDLITCDIRIGGKVHRGYGKVKGSVIQSEILTLPGSKLDDLCKGLSGKGKLGPYQRQKLLFECIFRENEWNMDGLDESLRSHEIATILEQCHGKFLGLVKQEEGKPHGKF